MPEQVIENAIVQFQDLAIYPSDIEQICEKYIATLPNPEMVYKTAGFSGMLDAIYNPSSDSISRFRPTSPWFHGMDAGRGRIIPIASAVHS